jgi:hypothetical protein
MSNKNVTTQLIGRYLSIRLQKNSSLLKILNPLRKELKLLSNDSIKNQKLFTFSNYKFLYIKKKKILKSKIRLYLKYFFKIFKYYYFYEYKKFKNFFFFNIVKYHKFFINNFKIYKKVFYINIFYKNLLDFFLVFRDFFKNSKIIINFIFYSVFALLKVSFLSMFKKSFVLNNKNIYISSFFYRNFFNYKYINYIWLLYKKLNYR